MLFPSLCHLELKSARIITVFALTSMWRFHITFYDINSSEENNCQTESTGQDQSSDGQKYIPLIFLHLYSVFHVLHHFISTQGILRYDIYVNAMLQYWIFSILFVVNRHTTL